MGAAITKSAPVPGKALKAPERTPQTKRLSPRLPSNQTLLRLQRKSCSGGAGTRLGFPFHEELPLQPKLVIGSPDDEYEREADRVADQVMRMPDPVAQRQGCDARKEREPLQTVQLAKTITSLVQRSAEKKGAVGEEQEEIFIQRQAFSGQPQTTRRRGPASMKSERVRHAPVPLWFELPQETQTELAERGITSAWFDQQIEATRLTVLNLYVKLRGMHFLHYVWRIYGEDITKPGGRGNFHFDANVSALKKRLTMDPRFTSPESGSVEWTSREMRYTGALHFKHFQGWSSAKVQAHIDPAGAWLTNPVTRMPAAPWTWTRHGIDYSERGWENVFKIREILLRQGWWPQALLGESTVQVCRKALAGSGTVSPQMGKQIDSFKDNGRPLPALLRGYFEPRFGADLSMVRIHNDSQAAEAASHLQAHAFTVGRDIVFGAGQYAPHTTRSQRLLAHELAHVIQQNGKNPPSIDGARCLNSSSNKMLQRSRALFVSTHGKRGFTKNAVAYHQAKGGYPPAQWVSSAEEMLEHMAAMAKPIEWLRIVTHATGAGIMLPLLRGGTTGLFKSDLALQRVFEMEQELGTEHPTFKAGPTYISGEVRHHIVPAHWVHGAWKQVKADTRESAKMLVQIGLRQSPRMKTDMHSFWWWIIDRELLRLKEKIQKRSKVKWFYAWKIPGSDRELLLASFGRNISIFRNKVRAGPYARGVPMEVLEKAPPESAGPRTAEQVIALEKAIVKAARPIVESEIKTGWEGQFNKPTPGRYASVQGALERGTYTDNVLRVRYAIANDAELQIRGCNIGKNRTWLESFQDFFAHGMGERRSKPHVSAPKLRQFYGLVKGNWEEWLLGKRGRRIYPNQPDYETNFEHVR